MNEPYIFDETDHEVVKLAMHLLAKIWHSDLVPEKEKEMIAAMGSLLKEMPDGVHDYFNASVTLTGPRRTFGDHKIYHYWTIESQDGEISIDASGHFYRESTGGDSFTSFTWLAMPGCVTECRDFLEHLRMVDDAQPFGAEVTGIDLTQPGYTLRLELDGELVGGDENDDEEAEDDESDETGTDSDFAQLAACLWAFMDAESEMIYSLGGRIYALSGTDEEILRTLNALSRHDFRTVKRVKVPTRFGVVGADGSKQGGLAAPNMLNNPDAMLFNELFNELENSLPPLPDFVNEKPIKQSLGEDPLTCRTLVYEDATGACRAIVDPSDVEWLRSHTSAQ